MVMYVYMDGILERAPAKDRKKTFEYDERGFAVEEPISSQDVLYVPEVAFPADVPR